MENQNEVSEFKTFYARRNVMLSIILMPIFFIISLYLPGKTQIMSVISIIFFVVSIWRYNLVYIKIGSDFISIRPPAPIRGTTNILFDEIKTIGFNKKKILITYFDSIAKKDSKTSIVYNLMDDSEQKKLMVLLDLTFKDKII